MFRQILALAALVCLGLCCVDDGKTYKNGETFDKKGAFRLQCNENENGWSTKIIGCLAGESKEFVPVGQKKSIGNTLYSCNTDPSGSVQLRGEMSPTAACVDKNGKKHSVGSNFIVNNNFEMTCRPGGVTEMVGCVSSTGKKIPKNTLLEINGVKHHCESLGNSYRYYQGEKKAH